MGPYDLPILRSLLKSNLNKNISILPSEYFCFLMPCTHFCTVRAGNIGNCFISADLSSSVVGEVWDCYTSCCRSPNSLTELPVVKIFLSMASRFWLLNLIYTSFFLRSLISSVSLHDFIDPHCSQWKGTDITHA